MGGRTESVSDPSTERQEARRKSRVAADVDCGGWKVPSKTSLAAGLSP